MAYQLEGNLLEVCDCGVLCPCWIGEDPDNGTCEGMMAWNFDKGTIDGTDVSGLTVATVVHIPGNILKGNWTAALFVDDRATEQQEKVLVDAWSGNLGGPLADMRKLIGDVVAVKRTPITFELQEGAGTLLIGGVAEAVMVPYRDSGGRVTTLRDSIFSNIPGSPAYVSKASRYKRTTKSLGLKDVDLQNHNAIQGKFLFVA
jgi:hypothetical protein